MQIKQCPFCGEKENLQHIELVTGTHYIQCNRCGASPYMLGARDFETAIKFWNREDITDESEVSNI